MSNKAYAQYSISDIRDGKDGVGILELEEQYYKSTSNSSQTGGNWLSTQPTWEDGYYIWTRLKITWDNDVSDPEHITYTDPVLATTYQSLHTDVINRINNIATKDANGNWSLTNGVIENTYVYTSEGGDPIALGEIGANITTTKDQILSTVSSTYATTANLNSEINKRKATYVTCSTGAGTKAKIGSCSNFELYNGAAITCVFANSNTQAAPTLNVNGTGAKTIVSYDGKALTESEYKWKAGSAYTLVYDGTNWRMQDSGTVARLTTAESSIQQNADNIELKVSESDVTGNYLIGKINLDSTTATISADRVNITGDVIVSKLSDANKNTISANAISKANTAIVEQKTLYYLTNGNAPAKPTSAVTSVSTSTGVWTTVIPTPKNGYTYYTCTQTKNGAGTYAWIGDSNNKGIKMSTDSMIANWCSASDSTYINGGSIYANSITTSQLATDAIKSINYQSASDANSPYSSSGSFFDLSSGNIYTPNFGVQSTTGKAYLNGEIIATSGTIGDDSGNYWEIGNTTDTDGGTSASIVGNGTAYIQDGDFQIHNGASNYSKGSINTQWYATVSGGLKITYPFYANTYYDFGMTSPVLDTTDISRFYNETVSQNFLYIRKHASTIPTLASDWNYVFRVDKDGNAYVNNLYVNGTSIATMISDGVDGGAYLPTSGGTVSGNVTITGTLTATASKAINDSDGLQINSTYVKKAGSQMSDDGYISRKGKSMSWQKGRDGALIKTTTVSAYSPFASIKTTNGSWDIGAYNTSSHYDDLLFSYVADTLYNSSTTQFTKQIKFLENGHIVADGFDGNATSATTAATATKATQDASGNVITETYAKINDTSLTGATMAESITSDEVIARSLIVNGDARFVNTINGDISGNAATATSATSANTAATASSANKLNTNAGSGTQPVYFANGVPVATTYALNKTVPADAKFTDTTYTPASSVTAVGTTAVVGTSANYARQDHVHNISLATGDSNGQVKIAGSNVSVKGLAALAYKASLGASDVGLGSVDNAQQVRALSSGTTSGHLVTWGANGYTVADSGVALAPNGNTRGIVSGVASNSSGQLVLTYADGSTSSGIDVEFVATQTSSVQKAEALNVNGTAVGSATVPVYFNAQGKPQTANTIPKLNNTTTGGAFYAPTSTGSSGQVITYPSSGSVPVWTNQSSLSVGSATKATQDGNGKNINDTYLKKATDTMTGTLIIKPSTTIATNTPATIEFQITQTDNNITTNGNFIKVYDDHDAYNYGGNMVIQSASGVVIGAGESPTAYYNNVMKDVTTEKLTLISDGSIEIFTNANTFANRKGITIDSSLNLYPQTTNTGSVGTSSYKWNAMYATTFYGELSGNASTATALKTSGTIQTNLASTSSATYTSGGNITPGITGTLEVGNGGTGQTTAVNAANSFLSALPTWTADPTDTTYFIRQDTAGTNSFGRLPFSTVWNYIKGKINAVDDIFVKLSGDQTIAGTKTFSSKIIAQSGIAVNTTSGTAGGISLYSTNPTNYGIAMRQTSNSGLHGYVQGDWAIYSYMSGSNATNKLTRGWIFKNVTDNIGVASISGAGNAVFNGSVTVGGNTGNTSGAKMEFNSTNNCIDFIFN